MSLCVSRLNQRSLYTTHVHTRTHTFHTRVHTFRESADGHTPARMYTHSAHMRAFPQRLRIRVLGARTLTHSPLAGLTAASIMINHFPHEDYVTGTEVLTYSFVEVLKTEGVKSNSVYTER